MAFSAILCCRAMIKFGITFIPDTSDQPTQQPDPTIDEILAGGLNELLDEAPTADYSDM